MKVVEVYKTNVQSKIQGSRIIGFLHRRYPWYNANFDLDDIDRILRVESFQQSIDNENIISVMEQFGCKAEPLPD
ncbi:MAG: hypothetical protein KF862_08640 [Chitinophagaceae bacterium]|nr:hypothetical protein [Chitinophagaceae bacterium]